MSASTVYLWRGGILEPRDDCDLRPATTLVADSWLVKGGAVLALDLHRTRFMSFIPPGPLLFDPAEFWDAAIAAIPRTGEWFPRIELRIQSGAPQLIFRLREAPELKRSIVLATHAGEDPRTAPRVKGPDLEAMTRLRSAAQARGADDAVLLSPEGFVAEGSTTSLLWWRGDALCVPDDQIDRIDGVTVRSVVTLAAALGYDVQHDSAVPNDLEGLEVWALNALHSIRIVTSWVDGPATAEEPGRLASWRNRLDKLRHPLPVPDSIAR